MRELTAYEIEEVNGGSIWNHLGCFADAYVYQWQQIGSGIWSGLQGFGNSMLDMLHYANGGSGTVTCVTQTSSDGSVVVQTCTSSP